MNGSLRRPRLSRLYPAAAIACALVGPAQAQFIPLPDHLKGAPPAASDERLAPDQVQPTFDRLIADLGSTEFATRQRASERLASIEQFNLALMERALKRPDLTLEARHRLSNIARQRFYRTPRAALGFKFGGQLRDRVVVGELFSNFPSFRILELGDVIVGADGFKIEGPGGQAMLQSVIISHDPGQTIHLTVRRGSRKLEVDIPLGRFADLEQGGGALMEDRLARAWRIRMQGLAAAQPAEELPRIDIAPARWGPTPEEAQRKLDAVSRREALEPTLRFAGGGMPRGVQLSEEARAFEQVLRPQVVIIRGQAQVMNMPMIRGGQFGGWGNFGGGFGDLEADIGRMAMSRDEELAQLLNAKMQLTRTLGGVDPATLPDTDIRKRDLVENKKQLELITRQFDAIQAEKDEARAEEDRKKPSVIVPDTRK